MSARATQRGDGWTGRRLMMGGAGAAAVALAILVAGCGSSSSSSSTTAATASSSTNSQAASLINEATAEVAKYSQPATTVGPTTKLPKPAKSFGPKFAIFMQNPTPTSAVVAQSIKEATAVLGWKLKVIAYTQETAPAIQGAYTQAIAENPNVIFDSATPPAIIAAQRATMKTKGIAFVTCCAVNPANTPDPPLGISTGANTFGFQGRLLADWMISKTNGHVNALIVTVPTFTVFASQVTEEQARLKSICPTTCKTSVLNVQVTALGSQASGMIVSELQRDPSANYVSLAFGTLGVGLAPALKQAGLQSRVKVIGMNPSPSNLADLTSGDAEMWDNPSADITGWQMVNIYLSHLAGLTFPIEATSNEDTGPTALLPPTLLTAKDGPFNNTVPTAPSNYQEIFKGLWGL